MPNWLFCWDNKIIYTNAVCWQLTLCTPSSPLWSTFWSGTLLLILHTFLHPIIAFSQHTHTITTCFAVVVRLCHLFLVSLKFSTQAKNRVSSNVAHPSDHSHLCLLKCHFIFFLTDQVSLLITYMQHTSNITAIQSSSHYRWYMYIHIGKQWYQLPEFISPNSNSGLHSCIGISNPHLTCHFNSKTYPLTADLHWNQYLHLHDLYWLLDSSNVYK